MGEPRRYQSGAAASPALFSDGRCFHSTALQSFWLARPHGHSTPAETCPRLEATTDMRSLDEFAAAKLAELERADLRRRLVDTTRLDGIWALRNGRRLLVVLLQRLSQSVAASRPSRRRRSRRCSTTASAAAPPGWSPAIIRCSPRWRRRLARLKGTQAACVFGSGYLANIGIIPALIGAGDLVLIDELAHACLWAGARLPRATVLPFRHSDLAHLRALLEQHRARHRRALIATDGVFSMDGDLAPVPGLAALAERFDAWLMTDDAHGIGVVGGGRGSTFAAGQRTDVPLQMGTLSKAIGAYGGYLCASAAVIELIHNRARSFVYSTGLPPAIAAAAIAALDLIEADPAYAALPLAKAQRVHPAGRPAGGGEPDRAADRGDAQAALAASRLLEAEGFLVIAIRPPTVPAGTARCASPSRPSIPMTRSSGSPTSCGRACGASRRSSKPIPPVAGHDRDLRQRDRNRCRQDLRDRRAHPAFPCPGPRRGCHQAGGERVRSGGAGRQRPGRAPGRARTPAHPRRDRPHLALAFRGAAVARPGGRARRPRHRLRRRDDFLPQRHGGAPRPSPHRGHRRHHGPARRQPHRARSDDRSCGCRSCWWRAAMWAPSATP